MSKVKVKCPTLVVEQSLIGSAEDMKQIGDNSFDIFLDCICGQAGKGEFSEFPQLYHLPSQYLSILV